VADARPDILVYETEPLAERSAFAGPLTAVLHASTTGRDADWFVTLCEVNAEGEIFQLTRGKIRARFRNSMRKPELPSPDAIYRYTIDFVQTGIRIAAGAKLRVEVAGAVFPLFSRNLNTGGHNETETEFVRAVHRIYHDRERPSYIEMPVIE
jgi:putative CocE/NonD family hydrolase